MRDVFITAGGPPTRFAPHCIVLGESRWFDGFADDMRQIIVPLDHLPGEATRFTYSDSFTAMAWKLGTNLRARATGQW